MACRLCLSTTEILIPIFDKQGNDIKGIIAVVNKFLNIQLSITDEKDTRICISCWASLDSFQKFCRLIEVKQSQLNVLAKDKEVEAILKHEKEIEAEVESELEIDNDINSVKSIVDVLLCDSDIDAVDDVLADVVSLDDVSHKESEVVVAKKIMPSRASKKINKTNQANSKSRGRPRTRTQNERKEVAVDRSAAVRKIGRPAKQDVNLYLDEDRLISNHMQLICDECQAVLKTFYELKKHFKKEHNREGYAVCCSKRLYKKGLLVEHINVHNNPDYFKCKECAQVFADRVCLRNHTLLKHKTENDLPFACKSCPKRFAKIYFLQRHSLKHATGDQKTFRCEECGKGYPSLSRLKGHLRNVHGDGGVKVCSHCGDVIRGTSAFQKHTRMHEGITDPGVQCDVCGQWLSDKYVLRLHMERHDDPKTYTCELCGKEAPSRLAMNAHYRYHHTNSEPLHKCSVCDKAFKTPRSLREHIATHTGETLYTCNYCPKTFKCSSNLHSHRKWQHPVEWAHDKQSPRLAGGQVEGKAGTCRNKAI